MNRDLSGEDLEINPPGFICSFVGGRSMVGSGGSPAERGSTFGKHVVKDPLPDFIVRVKVESEFVDDSTAQEKDLIVKVKVESEFVDKFSQGETQPVNRENFQSNFRQTSQDTLSKKHVKQKPCDSPLRKPINAAQKREGNAKQGKKLYKCSVCSKSFMSSASVRRHEVIHTGKRPFVCCVCNKAFSRSSDLHQHRRIHSGVKPYKCSVCLKAFGRSSNMYQHQRMHTREKHRCSVCHKDFARRATLTKHQEKH
uniref:C2H2-type domain-containing protein n=1 Tax=Eptatretus burgeri TaxID=7764 RepID=A0A8C4QD84_EPTBU